MNMVIFLCLFHIWLFSAFASEVLKGLPNLENIYGQPSHTQEKRAMSEKKVSLQKRNASNTVQRQELAKPVYTKVNQPLEKDTKIAEYTFREMNLLREDMVLKGINPAQDFYIPVYRNLIQLSVLLRLSIPEYLRKDSSVSVLVDDVPMYTFTPMDSGKPIYLNIKPKMNKDFVKISIKGNLRLSNNICEDVFSDKPYLIIHADSTATFKYKKASDIQTFMMDYDRIFCVDDQVLLPLVYHISSIRSIPPIFKWGIDESCEKVIKLSQSDTYIEGDTLYINVESIEALQAGYGPFLFGNSIKVEKVGQRESSNNNVLSLRDMGIKTATVRGMANISFYIPFNTASIGGMPDTLYMKLNFAHTPAHQKDKMELRVYLNDALIKTLPLEGYGTKSLDIKIPSTELVRGHNSLMINLVNFTSLDNCFGAVTQSAITVFDNSYFYWNNVSKEVKTISDFFRMINGRVGLIIEDKNMMPFVVKLLNLIPLMNKNIREIQLIGGVEPKAIEYDFILKFKKPNMEKGLFEIYDPKNGSILFSAKYNLPFIYLSLKSDATPELVVSYYENPNFTSIADKYGMEDYLNLYGDVAVVAENYFASFETYKKLRVRYENEKSLAYYWERYKVLVLILLAVPILYLLMYTYRKLTRRAT